MRRRSTLRRIILLAAVISSFQQADAQALPDLEPIKRAALVVRVTGKDPTNSEERTVEGTGFFISKVGYLVTSKHLRTKLGNIDEPSIRYEIRYGPNGVYSVEAAEAWKDVSPSTDILVLYASVDQSTISPLGRGSEGGLQPAVTPIYSGGFPDGIQYSVRQGYIQALGIRAPVRLWTTTLAFGGGQSGSPVCLADAKVVAVAKGNLEQDPTTGVVVPVRIVPDEYWDDPGKRP
jgi:S1-C subfamily serine protease